MPLFFTPGVYFERVDPQRGAISAIRTDIAAFVGIAGRGPLRTPMAVNSWEQFQSTFGGFIPQGYLAYAIKAFFENGGQRAFVVRVASETVQTDTDPAVAQPTDRGASLVKSAKGFAQGALVTVSQTLATQTSGAVQPADRSSSLVAEVQGFPGGGLVKISQGNLLSRRRVKAASASDHQLFWDQPLDPGYDLTQPISFEISHQTPHLLAQVTGSTLSWEQPLENFYHLGRPISLTTGTSIASGELLDETGQATLKIEAASPGAWGNGLMVRVGRGHAASTCSSKASPTDRKSSPVESITGFTPGALVKISQDGVAPVYHVVIGVDPGRRRLIWDVPLEPAFDLAAAADFSKPISFETLELALSVYLNGQLLEVFAGLSMLKENADNYVTAVINLTSNLIRVSVMDRPLPAPAPELCLPNPQAANLQLGTLGLRGGRDGTASLSILDFTGSPASEEKWGLRALEDVNEASMVAIPDILIKTETLLEKQPAPAPPADPCLGVLPPPVAEPAPPTPREGVPDFSLDQIFMVQQALVEHCEVRRDRMALLDPPLFSQAAEFLEAREIQSWRQRFASMYAALYYPWVMVYDPLQLDGQVVRAIPPSGHVAGIIARTDLESGVHRAPANQELKWTPGASLDLDGDLQGVLNPLGINAIRNFPGRGLRLYGARTLSREPQWRYLNVRRLLIMIERALELALPWAVFEPNNLVLQQTVELSIASFLEALWERGALVGAVPEEAFFVRCNSDNNPPSLADLGRLVAEVGVAPVTPAEFIILRIGRTEEKLEISEQEGIGVRQ